MSDQPIKVRASLLDALQIDLIGPSGLLGDHREVLPQAPSRWYLTGFLVPTDADEDQRYDPNSDDEVDQAPAVAKVDENQIPEQAASKRSYLPSSLGLSVLVPSGKQELQAIIRYGEYLHIEPDEGLKQGSLPKWRRNPHEEILTIALSDKAPAQGVVPVPNSRGVEVVWSMRGRSGC